MKEDSEFIACMEDILETGKRIPNMSPSNITDLIRLFRLSIRKETSASKLVIKRFSYSCKIINIVIFQRYG